MCVTDECVIHVKSFRSQIPKTEKICADQMKVVSTHVGHLEYRWDGNNKAYFFLYFFSICFLIFFLYFFFQFVLQFFSFFFFIISIRKFLEFIIYHFIIYHFSQFFLNFFSNFFLFFFLNFFSFFLLIFSSIFFFLISIIKNLKWNNELKALACYRRMCYRYKIIYW